MRSKRTPINAANAWERYVPTGDQPWNLARVAHLHRRAGFAAPWKVLQRDLADGPDAAISRLLDGEPKSLDGQDAAAFEAEQNRLDLYAAATGNVERLQAAWLYRMIYTPTPLHERVTLFWHNHFATSNAKVKNTQLMRDQVAMLRANALGKFPAMLKGIARDPAMLLWLDSATNRRAHPNENYAREVMELFTLGRGKYTEKDIQEAARAFTGAFIQSDRFRLVDSQHDPGPKTILGKTGPFRMDDVAEILLDQDACALFVCRKLIKHFVSEVEEPTDELVEPLALQFRSSGYDIRTAIEMIVRSRLFFDSRSIRKRVKSPVEFTVGTIRALEVTKPTVSADALAVSCGEMGQALYAPPSVAGWDGGPAWINTASSIVRTNFVLGLLSTTDEKLGQRLDPRKLAARHGARTPEKIAAFALDLLLQDAPSADVRSRLVQAFIKAGDDDTALREAVTLVLTAPEYQLA